MLDETQKQGPQVHRMIGGIIDGSTTFINSRFTRIDRE